MYDAGVVFGGPEQAKPIIAGKDTVYVHTDIKPTITDGNGNPTEYQYHEMQYSPTEYIIKNIEDISDAIERGVTT